MYFSLHGVPVTSASRLPGLDFAVLLLPLTPELGQGQPNYQLAHEELRGMNSAVLESRCLLPLALRGPCKPLKGALPPRAGRLQDISGR